METNIFTDQVKRVRISGKTYRSKSSALPSYMLLLKLLLVSRLLLDKLLMKKLHILLWQLMSGGDMTISTDLLRQLAQRAVHLQVSILSLRKARQ